MSKARKAKIDQRGPLQRALDAERGSVRVINGVAEYHDAAPLVAEDRKKHGMFFRNGDTIQDAGCSTIRRWEANNLMEPSQMAAIAHCIRLWDAAENSRGMVIDLERVRGGFGTGDGWMQQEALDALANIKSYIPRVYFEIFENVVRFDEPGGYAGSRLSDVPRGVMARVRTIVQFTADIIAMKEALSY